jgi:hypothetical protein
MLVGWTSQAIKPLNYDVQWQEEGSTYGHVSHFNVGYTSLTE